MKTLNLFLKMHFTSLSPDGQPVSLAIVTSDYYNTNDSGVEGVVGGLGSKSFYAEFNDFDINRCDEWVKDNVISKLTVPNSHGKNGGIIEQNNNPTVVGDTGWIDDHLTNWLSQFSDYKLNFIVDCGWFTWYKFVELMGEWGIQKEDVTSMLANPMYDSPLKAHAKDVLIYQKAKGREMITETDQNGLSLYIVSKSGIPKLPANFPPVPIDLNDLIMDRKGFKSVADAFNVDREEFATSIDKSAWPLDMKYLSDCSGQFGKYNVLWDVKVTKYIYEKLK